MAATPQRPLAAGSARSHEAILTSPIGRTLFQLAWPITIANFVTDLATTVSAYWISRMVGTGGLAVIGLLLPLNALDRIMKGLSVGTEVLIAHSVGRGDGEGVHVLANGAYLTGTLTLVVVAGGLIAMDPLVSVLAGDLPVASTLASYLLFWLLVYPFVTSVYTFNAAVGGSGWTRLALWRQVVLLASTAAIVPLCIRLVGGIGGAPVASAVCSILLSLTMWRALRQRRGELALGDWDRRAARLDLAVWKRIADVAIAPALAHAAEFASLFLLVKFVAGTGKGAAAAFHLSILIFLLGAGLCRAVASAGATMIAQNYGARNVARVRHSFRAGALYSLAAGLVLMLAMGLLRPIVALLSDDPAVVDGTTRVLAVLRFGILPLAMFQMLRESFNAVAKNKLSNAVLVAFSVFTVIVAYLLPLPALEAAAWSLVLTNLLKVLGLALLYRSRFAAPLAAAAAPAVTSE